MKTVLHLIDSGGLYGAEKVLLNLSVQMAKSGKYCPIVGCIVRHADEENALYNKACEMGLSANKLVMRNSLLFIDLPRVSKKIKLLGVDLIHSHGYKPSVFGFFVKLITGIDILATCHLWYKTSEAPMKMKFMIWLELRLYKFFKSIVAVSEPIKNVLEDQGLSAGGVQVIKNGVEVDGLPEVSQVQKNELRSVLGIPTSAFCIVNLGRLTHQKSQVDIIKAVKALSDEKIECHAIIVGDGELKFHLQESIKDLGLKSCVHLLGFRDNVMEILQIADAFILPSLDEGMPMGMLEAGAFKLPIIATSVGDIPKVVKNMESGLIVSPKRPDELANAIRYLIHNPDKRIEFGRAVHEVIKSQFSCEVMFDEYDVVYSAFLK